MTAPALAVENTRFGYGDLTVVWDASLQVRPASALALVGRNGAGKTTLLSGIAGLLPCQAGSVRVEGQDVTKLPAYARVRRGLSFVQEGKKILRELTVRENLVLGTFGRPTSRKQGEQLIDEMCTRFPPLAQKLKEPAGSLSGGQQQMLAIAQALVNRPVVLLLDEPASGLAPVVVDEVLNLVGGLKQEGLAILIVSEGGEEVLASGVADEIAVIDQGRLVLSGRAGEVTTDDIAAAMQIGPRREAERSGTA